MGRLNAGQASVAVTGEILNQLRKKFSEAEPFGGKIPEERVQHRVGSEVVIDGFSEGDEDCEGLAWVSAVRRYRTTEFPAESFTSGNCGTQRALAVLVGVARCAATLDHNGAPPSPQRINEEAIRGLDDAHRLDTAICAAGNELDERGAILGWAVDAVEPVGPQGGVIIWVCQAAFLLA